MHNYQTAFQNVFKKENITITDIQSALSAYLESLAPMHSPFDQYMAGDHLCDDSATAGRV